MKKMITLAALALMIGIYAFQNNSNVSEVTTEDLADTKTPVRRKVASIPSHEKIQVENAQGISDANVSQVEHDTINCLNYDGEDICQSNDYSSQDNFIEESYVQNEQEAQAIEEPQMDMDDASTVDYERENTDNVLFASTPAQSE